MSDHDFRAFVHARWPALVRFAWTLVGDQGHAEDLVQLALERCWRHWSRIEPGHGEAYVRASLVNLAVSRSRHVRRRVRETALDETVHERPAEAGDRAAPDELLLAELRALPPRMRAVVVLRFLEDRSEAQTAQLLRCSVGTVKSQSARALARLRERPGLRELASGSVAEGN